MRWYAKRRLGVAVIRAPTLYGLYKWQRKHVGFTIKTVQHQTVPIAETTERRDQVWRDH